MPSTSEDVELTENVLREKIADLFASCDIDSKGYTTRNDLYSLKNELGLSRDDIDTAFDQMDKNRDDRLTLSEFVEGFGLFIGLEGKQPLQRKTSSVNADFAFQVFSLIDQHDSGFITKQDILDSQDTLEIDPEQVDFVFDRLRSSRHDSCVYFEDFVQNIGSVIAFSPTLQEIQLVEEEKHKTRYDRMLISRAFKMDLSGYTKDEVARLLNEQATALFHHCDVDDKGHVTYDDLLALSVELDLSEESVREAFNHLDTDGNGCLEKREFLNGFGWFLGVTSDDYVYNFDDKNNDFDDKNNSDTAEMDRISECDDKVLELFELCDRDAKGYVTIDDLNTLTTELGLTNQQVSDIFMQLDNDGNGCISLEEFVRGFSALYTPLATAEEENHFSEFSDENRISSSDYITNNIDEKRASESFDAIYFTDSAGKKLLERDSSGSQSSERNFIQRQMSIRYEAGGGSDVDEILENLEHDVNGSISKEQMLALWSTVNSTGDPNTTQILESFFTKVYSEIRMAKQEAKELETVLEKKSYNHSEEIRRITDEMENQIQSEKLKQKQLDARKEFIIREDLEKALRDKERHLQKTMQRQAALEKRLEEGREKEQMLKIQNSKLVKENNELEDKLNTSMSNLEHVKSSLQHLEKQTSQEKKETFKAALQATQGMSFEHEDLIRRLETLKTMNQRLRDDRDTIEASLKSNVILPEMLDNNDSMLNGKMKVKRLGSNLEKYLVSSPSSKRSTSTPQHSPLVKKDSVLSNYFPAHGNHKHESSGTLLREGDDEGEGNMSTEDIEVDKFPLSREQSDDLFNRQHSDDEAELRALEATDLMNDTVSGEISGSSTPQSPRRPPVGRNSDEVHSQYGEHSITPSQLLPPENPNRVYKVVFVGDSGVGKSSFIYRFCYEDFRPNFCATIGVDFQVKTVQVLKQWVALQLWDTAGQERFHSITKQYFRRADGIIVMFDLNSESSFTNVKGWMLSVEEGAEDDCSIMLVGNKQDLCNGENAHLRKVKREAAERIAKNYNGTYSEVSAYSGGGVEEAMLSLAQRMGVNEDQMIQKRYQDFIVPRKDDHLKTEKRKCCGS